MTSRTRLIVVFVAALVVEAIVVRLGWIADPLPKAGGAAVWTTSRAAGVTAFAALTLDVLFGLFISTGLLDRWIPRGASVDVHKWLSSVSLSLIAVHAIVLLADGFVHYDAIDIMIPGVSSYRPGAVAIGILATYAALAVHLSFGWRKRIGVRVWRALHFLSFAVFVAAIAHGILAGSDASHRWLQHLYAGSGAVVSVLVMIRIAIAVAGRVTSYRRCSRVPS